MHLKLLMYMKKKRIEECLRELESLEKSHNQSVSTNVKEAEGFWDREGFGSDESKGFSGSSSLRKIRGNGEIV